MVKLRIKIFYSIILLLVTAPVYGLQTLEREIYPDRPVLSLRLHWDVIGYVGEFPYFDPSELIGKRQHFYKVYSQGPFLNCNHTDRSVSKISTKDFFNSPIFSWWKKHNETLKIDGKHVYVEDLACPENMTSLFPFVTASNSDWAYIPFGTVIFILKGAPQVPFTIGPDDD